MTSEEIRQKLALGETSAVQFKKEMPHKDSVAQEIVAMSNSIGGTIFIGVEDISGDVVGLSSEQIEQYDKDISYIADNLRPTVYITTEIVTLEKNILLVHVPEGVNKPYKTAKGEIFVKQGANKRLLTDNAEIARLFQQSANLMADEMEVYDTDISDIDSITFENYFKREFGVTYQEKGLSYKEALRAKRVLRNGRITLAGLLFFGKDVQSIKPAFTVKMASFFGNDITSNNYRDKPADMPGTIPMQFERALGWVKANLHSTQNGQNFNSIGVLEISEVALIELIQNAFIHRDYFKNAPIRILVFENRVEIISPGKLPNTLTVEDIKYGNPVIRNNQIAAFASRLLPYSGLGSGIRRALQEQPDIILENDVQGEQFKVTIPRKPFV